MLCKNCPMHEVNKSNYILPETCWYGDKYFEEHTEYFTKYKEWGCRKHKKTIMWDFCPPGLRDLIKSDKRKEEYLAEWVKSDNLPIDKIRS